MIEVRCNGCGKLLGFFEGKGKIKCTRTACGYLNEFDTKALKIKPDDNRQKYYSLKDRTTSSGVTFL